jgi:hypothetical protein
MTAPASPCAARAMNQGMQMRQGPMASMAGALDTAVWGDHVYVLQGNMLEKRDMEGNVVKSVQLKDMERTMQQMQDEGVCPMCGMSMEHEGRMGCPGAMEGSPCPTCGGTPGMGMQGRMRGMDGQNDGEGMHRMGGMHGEGRGMHRMGGMHGQGMTKAGMKGMQKGKMYSKVELNADANGVYLLRGGQFTAFDHDLNQTQSWQAVSETCLAKDDSVECAMQQARKAKCPTCRMMMGTMQDERGIQDGTVTMWHRPAELSPGMVRLQVQVDDLSDAGDADAKVNAYLYPRNDVDAGMGVQMHPTGGGHFYGLVDVPSEGMWELALRVIRPGMEDVKVYYDLAVE